MASPAQLAARQKFTDMIKAKSAAKATTKQTTKPTSKPSKNS